jgi:hypothetical protein
MKRLITWRNTEIQPKTKKNKSEIISVRLRLVSDAQLFQQMVVGDGAKAARQNFRIIEPITEIALLRREGEVIRRRRIRCRQLCFRRALCNPDDLLPGRFADLQQNAAKETSRDRDRRSRLRRLER